MLVALNLILSKYGINVVTAIIITNTGPSVDVPLTNLLQHRKVCNRKKKTKKRDKQSKHTVPKHEQNGTRR
jgi:hypothetical protein